MKFVLTLFMLIAFALFLTVDNAEAILNLDTDTFLDQLEEEAVSLAPNAVVLEVKAVPVSNVLKWPHEDIPSSTGLDVQKPNGLENSSAEGGSGRGGILPGGGSRFQ